MLNNRSPRTLIIGAIVLIIISYTFFEARKVITGPQIIFTTPENGAEFSEALIQVEGKTKNINSITLNDKPIFIDDFGVFREKLLLSPGYNIIEVEAKDRFGKPTRETLEVVFTGTPIEGTADADLKIETGTSTTTSTSSPTTTEAQN